MPTFQEYWNKRPWHKEERSDKEIAEDWFLIGIAEATKQPVSKVGSKDLLTTEIADERQRQINKGFDHRWDDEAKTEEDWCNDIEAYIVGPGKCTG